jgi:hypothetical protein
MNFRVSYISEPTANRNGGLVEDIVDRDFGTLEEAQAAPFPENALFAFIVSAGGYFSCQKGFNWTFHADDVPTPRAR